MVLSSPEGIDDQIAGAQEMVLTSRGLSIRDRNPGNIHLFLNALHWLNDRTEWMDVGTPVTVGTINIAQGPTLSLVKVFAAGVWPAIALTCGLIAWWVRRR